MTLHPIFIVRNSLGQYLGSYRAKDARQAIQRFIDGEARTASTFRKSQPMGPRRHYEGLTATKKEEHE